MSSLANFRTSIAAELGLDNTASSADQVEIDRRVNEGVTDVLLRTSCNVAVATASETSGDGDYTLDAAILKVVGWQFTSTAETFQPERVTIEELLWRRSYPVTSAYPASAYAVAGSNLLMVYPTPSAADTLTIYYVPRPATLSAGTDTPSEIPTEFHPAVELYALWKLGSMSDDQSSGQGERYRTQYEGSDGTGGMIARLRGHVNRKGGRRGRAQLNPARRLRRGYVLWNDTGY